MRDALFSNSIVRESNAGSVTQLVNSEQPLAIVSMAHAENTPKPSQYTSQPCLNTAPVYSNVTSEMMTKSQSLSQNLDAKVDIADLYLDTVELSDAAMIHQQQQQQARTLENNDLTSKDKENLLMSANRMQLLRETTMIESALDLD